MVRVIWAPEALSGIELARSYMARFNPVAADRLAERLRSAGDSLNQFPNRGRPQPTEPENW
jgi:plasmid stabilization system protein ParE